MENYFESNVELWARTHPKEAVLLPYLEEGEIRLCKTLQAEDNICLQRGAEVEYFHSQNGARAEAQEWFNALKISDLQLLYVYGIGLGYYYEAALTWLQQSSQHVLVFLEDDPAVLRKFLETQRAHDALSNPQVQIVYLRDRKEKKAILGELYWDFAFAKVQISALRYYQEHKATSYDELCHEISFGNSIKKEYLSEYLSHGASYFVNCYQNLFELPKAYLASRRFGKFSKVPAIICGAGPSLEKNRGGLISCSTEL